MPAPPMVEIKGGKLTRRFHAGQTRAWQSTKRIVAVIAGSQSGKTVLGPHWLHREIMQRGPGDYMVVTPSYPLLQKKALPEFLLLFDEALQLGKYNTSDRIFRFSPDGLARTFGDKNTGPTKVFFGYAANPDSLESATAKGVWLDEAGQKAFRQGSWEAINRRVAVHQGRILITTTPYNLGWLKTVIYDPWLASGKNHADIDVVNFGSGANPAFPREELERMRRELPAWKYNMMVRGEFSRPAGLIYDRFDAARHVRPRFGLPKEWQRYVGLDFGAVNTGAVFFAEEKVGGRPTGRYIAYREYHPARKMEPAEHYASLTKDEPRLPTFVGGSRSEDEWRERFAEAGIPVFEPPMSGVEVGIDALYEMIARDELIVMDDLVELLDELGTYSRVVTEAGDATEKIDGASEYHLCFVAGTKVATGRGLVNIEDVRFDDVVLTRVGESPVTHYSARYARDLIELTMSDGRRLVGTSDHPIWVCGVGFVPMDSLRYNDVVHTIEDRGDPCQQETQTSDESRLSCSGLPGFGIPTRNEGLTACISSIAANACTAKSGGVRMARFRPSITFTIKTTTPATTTLPTSNCCRPRHTCNCTTRAFVLRRRGRTSTGFALLPSLGVKPRLVASGTASMRPAASLLACLRKSNASGVEAISSLGLSTGIGFAPRIAEPPPAAAPALTTPTELVPSVASRFASTNTPERGLAPRRAPVRVVALRSVGSGTVFNLRVAGPHEYYANGVLVSNCDALRYFAVWVKRGGKTWDDDESDENRSEISKAPPGVFQPDEEPEDDLGDEAFETDWGGDEA